MSETRTRRGRPKGSGIDDRQRLDAIARMITENPALKPTTAIRTLGVSDPSVIRRLRDKFSIVRSDLMQELAAADSKPRKARLENPAPTNRPQETPARAERSRAVPANTRKDARISTAPSAGKPPVVAAGRTTPRQAAPSPRPEACVGDDGDRQRVVSAKSVPSSEELIMSIMSAGMAATQSLWSAQAALAGEVMKWPCVSLALRQQLAFNEWAAGFVPATRPCPKTAN